MVGEIIDGELYAWPRPSGSHGDASSVFLSRILTPYRLGDGGPGGWWIIGEPEVHFVRDMIVVVPDIGGWRRERMPEIPKDHRFIVSPDWVCEVLSPSTRRHDRGTKTGVDKVVAEPFPAAEIDLAAIWGSDESPLPPP